MSRVICNMAGKTLPDEPAGKRPCVDMLQSEVRRLQAEIRRLGKRKRTFEPGSPQFRYLMNLLQRFFNTQHNQQSQHREGPGHTARATLMELLNCWMTQLDDTATEHGFDWRKVPDRPHAQPVVFNVDE